MKILIATVSIISIAFGYIIGKLTFSSSKETDITSKAETRNNRSNTRTHGNGDNALLDAILAGRPISDVPPADLAAIFIKLSKPNPNADNFSRARQAYQFEFLLSKLSAADLANVATELSSDPETKNSREFWQIFSTLAAKDPDRALEWMSKQENSSEYYPAVIRAIAENDPLRASSLLNSAMADGKMDKNGLSSVCRQIAFSTAKLGADPFLSYLDSLPKASQIGILDTISDIPENDRFKLLDQIHQRIQDGRLSGVEIDSVFSLALQANKNATTEWLNKLPENEQKNYLRTKAVSISYLTGDKESAAEWMKQNIAASPGREKEIIKNAINDLQHVDDHESTSFLASLLPEGETFTAEELSNSIEYSPIGITVCSKLISDPNEKSIYIANSLKEISKPDSIRYFQIDSDKLDALSRDIAAMGFTGQNATRVNNAIEAAKKQIPPSER